MADPSGEAVYPINAVSKLTGVSCHALRVWERRYGFPVPRRSPSGHRRYGVDQVVVLRKLSELSRAGQPIGELIAALRSGRLAIEVPAGAAEGAPVAGDGLLAGFLDRMLAGDLAGAVALFEALEAAMPPEELIARVIAPALTEIGERWFRRRCAIYQERCVSEFLRRRLDGLIDAARRSNPAPRHTALLGTVQGDRHEGGALIAHLLLERAGWRAINLGVDLPVAEYARAVEALRPDALALSFVLSRNINKRFKELSRLRGVPVFVGGRSILNYRGWPAATG
jgi:methanogenic corrinoid protein MtbC1